MRPTQRANQSYWHQADLIDLDLIACASYTREYTRSGRRPRHTQIACDIQRPNSTRDRNIHRNVGQCNERAIDLATRDSLICSGSSRCVSRDPLLEPRYAVRKSITLSKTQSQAI